MGACSAVFVQRQLDGRWVAWQGSTQNDNPPPPEGHPLHFGQSYSRGAMFCKAFDNAGTLPVIQLDPVQPKLSTLQDVRVLISNDDWIQSFPSNRDLCKALLKAIDQN